jgi:hypothetical protein
MPFTILYLVDDDAADAMSPQLQQITQEPSIHIVYWKTRYQKLETNPKRNGYMATEGFKCLEDRITTRK